MAIATYTKTGNKSTTTTKLDKNIYGVEVKNHDLLKQTYLAYLANGRVNLAVAKKRGEVRGGGRKPWRQKGTGRARVGSSRTPLWRGGGVIFGPTGNENYAIKIPAQTKKLAIRQALSLSNDKGKIVVIETFESKDGKTAPIVNLLKKMGVDKNVLIVVSTNDELVQRATRNIPNLKIVQANYLSVFDILNADHIIISQKSLPFISEWLTTPKQTSRSSK